MSTTHALVLDGVDEEGDATLPRVLDAVSSFVEESRSSVALSVIIDGTRRTLRATYDAGTLFVHAIDDRTRVGRRLDDSPITADELVWLFSAFYPEGKRLAQYTWRLKPV